MNKVLPPLFAEPPALFPGFDPYELLDEQQKRDFHDFMQLKILKKTAETVIEFSIEKVGLVGGFIADKLDLFGRPLNSTEAADEALMLEEGTQRRALHEQANRRAAAALFAALAIAKAAALGNGTGGQFPSWATDPPG